MSEAIPCLITDLFKAIEGGSKKKLKQTIKSLQPLLESTDTDATAVLENEKNPLKDTNLIILCCKFGHLNILDYFVNSGKPFIDSLYNGTRANVLSPSNRDGEDHSAFYYAIRSNNLEIVELLLTKWLPFFDDSVARKDLLLSEAYEELKLRNVRLTQKMELFVESEIVASRPFSNNDDGCVPDFKNELLKRMDWLLNNIESLNTVEVESKFLVLAKCIAQNMHILKCQLKATYDKIPWEELEFCLVTYIVSRIHCQENSIIPVLAINKETLLSQLGYFAAISKKLSKDDVLGPNELPNLTREEVASKIKNASPEFIPLYEVYHKVRDLYSLENLKGYLEVSRSVNHNKKAGQLAIVRILQVLSDYLKNDLDNCKLSENTSRVILSALPRNTREIVIDLRNTGSNTNSLKKRLEIEKKTPEFFRDCQKDLKHLSCVVSRILNNCKLRIVVDLLDKITKSDNIEDICELGKKIKLVQKCIDAETLLFIDKEEIQRLIEKLEKSIPMPDINARELQLVSDMLTFLSKDRKPHLTSAPFFPALRCFEKFKFDRKLEASELALLRSAAIVVLRPLLPPHHIERISEVLEFIRVFDRNLTRRYHRFKFSKTDEEKINMLLFEISFAASTNVEDVRCHDFTQEVDSARSTEQLLSESGCKKHLKSKLNVLKNLIGSEMKSANFLKENKEQRLAIEILLLDIFSILDGDESEIDVLYVGEFAPLLTGKCFKNYLAHGSALFDFFATDPETAIMSNAVQFIKNELSIEDCKIGKVFFDHLSEAKERLNENLAIVNNQDQLFRALEEGDPEKSNAMIKLGADVFGRSRIDETSLHFAARSRNIDVAKFIVEQDVKADLADKKGRTALHVAAAHGNFALVEYLLVNGANVDLEQKDKKGQTCLHLAARHGDAKTVAILIKMGADLFSLTHKRLQSSLTPIFGSENNEIVAGRPLERGAHIFGCGIIGQLTPLHIAAEYNRVDVIKLMLEKGIRVDIHSHMEGSPLIMAAENGCVEAVKVLINAGANVNAYFGGMFTALHFTADRGHTAMAALLLRNGAEADPANNPDKPIHDAALNGHSEIVKLLIKFKANFNRRNDWGCAPLHLAAQLGHTKVIQVLLGAGVDINSGDIRGLTPLHFATGKGRLEAAKLLIDKGAEINVIAGPLQCTALHFAADGGYEEIGELLVKSGAKIDVKRGIDGRTPLHSAIQKKANSLVRLLVERGANPEVKDKMGMTPLHFGSQLDTVDGVSHLLRFKCDVNARGKNRITPLHLAAAYGSCEMAELLLKNGANVNSTCDEGLTPLYTSVSNERFDMVQLLVKNGADVNLGNVPPALKAIDNDSRDILECLVKQGIRARKEDVLFKGITLGFAGCVRVLLENGFPADAVTDGDQRTLHYAVIFDFKIIASDLLHFGANVNSVDFNKMTPLHYAAKANNFEMVELLLASGANVDSKTNHGHTAFHLAAEFGDCRIIELLLSKGADPLAEDDEKKTPLCQSIRKGDVEKVKAMFQIKRLDKNVRFFNRMSTLHLSALHSLDVVKFLVNDGLVPNLVNDDWKPIHLASMKGKQDIVEYFLDLGVSVNETTRDKCTPLHFAASKGQFSMVKYLVSKGANVNARDNGNYTPLLLAKNNKDIVNFLSKNGAISGSFVNTLDAERFLIAVKNNEVNEVEKLIKNGIGNAIRLFDDSPLHIASSKGYYEIVKLLLDHNTNANVFASSKAYTPLHYAVHNSHSNIVLELLIHGAVYNLETYDRATPLRLARDKDIRELLSLIEKCFELVEKGDVTVESIIRNLRAQNERHFEALMKTRNRNNQGILEVSEIYKYPNRNELYEICHVEYFKVDPQSLIGRDRDIRQDKHCMESENQKTSGTPRVIAAVLKGDLDLLKELLEGGGGVNEADCNGRTALHYAVDRVDEKCVQLLLQYGADITHVSYKGNTALHTAVNKQSAPIVKMLLEFAVNNRKLDFINKPTLAKGNTALHVAAKNGNLDVLKILLKFGATYEIENLDGDKPQDLSSNVEIVHLFDLLSEMFADAETGNFRVVERMKSMEKEDVSAVAGARNLGGRTILQVAIGQQHRNISNNLLKIIQAASAK